MRASDGVRETRTVREWTVRLDCGHPLTVPWGMAPPFVAACIVHHLEICPDGLHAPIERSLWVPRDTSGGSFR
jgi:hypothetical protein